ncbi:hypothetical protein ACJW30_12G159700 [Castanea mollissima]
MPTSSYSFLFILLFCFSTAALAGDPFVFYDWTVSYLTASPLGVKQKVIGINGQFPGPILNVTTNWNVVVNVKNGLDEPFLLTWNGIQHRKNSWQDGVLGTNCPIPAGWNWTYQFQVKDQIGSFFYFPSLSFQRAAGGYGGIIINNREVIPVPFGMPDGDITIFISDWYSKSHKELRQDVEKGINLGVPDGILINGFGPYHIDGAVVPDGITYLKINVEPGKTYRLRVHNVGISTSLNFRIQNHNLLLVETEGSYTVQQNYTNMDVHVGQSYSFLVTMDQNASSDYYIVASPRFVNSSAWGSGTGVAILHYSNSQGPASGPLPDLPNENDPYFSMNQARSIRWNVSAGAARPNPQGSFKYGQITVTDVYVILNRPPELIDGKWRTTLNGISYLPPSTPLTLAQQFNIPGVYKLDFPNKLMNRPPKIDTSLINGTYRGFMEIILQNNDTTVQSYHLDGFAFFVVGMDFGVWTENSRVTYNKWDGVARCTTQVFPGAWTAILVSLDNAGNWNLRSENLDSWYLGQEVYLNVLNTENDTDEAPLPGNAIYCGLLSSLQTDQAQRVNFSGASSLSDGHRRILVMLLLAFLGTFFKLAFLKRIKAPNGGTYNLRKTTTTTTTLSAVLHEQPIGFRFFASQVARRTSCFKPWPKGDYVGSFRKMSATAGIGMAKNEEGLKLVLVNGGSRARKMVGIWLFGSAAWVFSMVLLGGVTRLTRSGLSMTDWKFTGSLPPLSEEEWLREFDKYKQSPEYKRINKGMSIEDFKFIYWMEYAHRMWGRALGVMFALPFSYFLRKGYITLGLGLRLSALFALGAGQGLIGWWMVKSGLEEPASEYAQPRVSPYRLAAHLTSAFAIYCGLFWTALSVVMPEPPAESVAWVRGAAKVKRLALPVGILVAITAVSGAFVAGNDAGHAYNTFPKMGDTWIPEDVLDMKPLIRNFFENTSTVQLDHRILATATLISIGTLWWSTRKLDIHPAVKSLIGSTMGMAALQVTLGISTLLSYVPVSLGTAHQAGALTLLTLMILLNHTVRRPSMSLLKSLPQVAKTT